MSQKRKTDKNDDHLQIKLKKKISKVFYKQVYFLLNTSFTKAKPQTMSYAFSRSQKLRFLVCSIHVHHWQHTKFGRITKVLVFRLLLSDIVNFLSSISAAAGIFQPCSPFFTACMFLTFLRICAYVLLHFHSLLLSRCFSIPRRILNRMKTTS